MRKAGFEKETAALLELGRPLSVADFMMACPGAPTATVYSKIRALLQAGLLSRVGRGKYMAVHKPSYAVPVTAWMRQVNAVLHDHCEGVNHCIREQVPNLIVEVFRRDVRKVRDVLKQHFPKVVLQKDADRFPGLLEGYILVGVLVSDAPVEEEDGICVPSLEKTLIDDLCRKGSMNVQREFQKTLEVYPVNMNRLQRYSARRGVTEELSGCISALDHTRTDLFSKLQRYFSNTPASRVWVFGSFARGEETKESDLDLIVDYLPDSQVSLLDMIRQRLDLEKIAGRSVDLVESGNLLPFAAASAERDKYLIYER